MNRDDSVHRLLLLSDSSTARQQHKPAVFNVKRRPLIKQSTSLQHHHPPTPKLSVQDFVRMDPGYTPDIEHLVFPGRKRNPQQVAPISSGGNAAKTRSRLAEMFALSRHLQQRSQEREKARNVAVSKINKSVDSALESRSSAVSSSGPRPSRLPVEEPVHSTGSISTTTSRISPAAESADMAAARGPNVSVLHLRGTSDTWDPPSNRSYTLTKHQSLSSTPNYKWTQSANFHKSTTSSTTIANSSPPTTKSTVTVNRELSPVRWCDRPVDGVYLNKSGWVQVQQRSLDDPQRRTGYATTASLHPSRRTGIKLADYHCNSEPAPPPRPAHLSLQPSHDLLPPSPSRYSPPPSHTPIISPPPAFQDGRRAPSSHAFFGARTHFLPRSNAVDSDEISPPPTPIPKWVQARNNRIAKSVEEATSHHRRAQFHQQSSSSTSSSSMGFRSLDSSAPPPVRPPMPRLSENTDSSIDVYEDADDEDNNSSSINVSIPPTVFLHQNSAEKKAAAGRRTLKRSPVGSDRAPTSPGSSSTSSGERAPSRSPSGSQQRRDEAGQRVRRSRSLQLPERNKTPPQRRAARAADSGFDMLKEAEVVTGFLYGNRSRAAAQALLLHRHNNNNHLTTNRNEVQVEGGKRARPDPNLTVYFVDPAKGGRATVVNRGANPKMGVAAVEACQTGQCGEYWRGSPLMRSSQSYPTHQLNEQRQRSLDSASTKRLVHDRWPSARHATKVIVGSASSSSGSERTMKRGSEASTPIEELLGRDGVRRGEAVARPGSAPVVEKGGKCLEAQHRSMSLPKSFLSVGAASGGARRNVGEGGMEQQKCQAQSGHQFSWGRNGTESLRSSPGLPRKVNNSCSGGGEISHTAPATPLHDGSRRRSPLGGASRCAKATSSPQLILSPDNRKSIEKNDTTKELRHNLSTKELRNRNLSGNATESVLQKFRKTFSLRFHPKKSSKENSTDLGETLPEETLGEPSDLELEASPQHIRTTFQSTSPQLQTNENDEKGDQLPEEKNKFGSLVWRSSKERNKVNKAARSAKCNSGDSGIQIEMVPCTGGVDSSESHNTDSLGDCELDSPPITRKRTYLRQLAQNKPANRPHSDLLNQILIDKFKSDLKQRNPKLNPVRRTRSDLGGHRLFWSDSSFRSSYRRMMISPAPLRSRLQSPRKKPPDTPDGVQLRHGGNRRGQLRRSLSQPLDIDKLSPLMRTKNGALRLGLIHNLSEDEHDARTTSDSETISDSESSQTSLTDRKRSDLLDDEMTILAEAVFDHVAIEPEELAFRAGDVVEVLETTNRDWWWGSTRGQAGWFPAQFVRLRVSQEETVEDCLAAMAAGKAASASIRRRTSISLLSNDQVRTSVVRELVHTERDFVKLLRDVADGYVAECRKRADMFNADDIETIFINLEEILVFQEAFLKDLELEIVWEAPNQSCVGRCFLRHRAGFKMYSDYCNSHPMATAALQELYQYNNYCKFFEACRLMRGLIEIPLDGYLLTPVQRICKYPLQLAELLKYTKPEHRDYDGIKEALEVMRGVAVLINERKRRMESLEKLAAWQQRVEAWEGEDLIEVSSQLIFQGEVIRVTTGMWTNNITLFLFDHQIVYCKKDILKRNTYVYKGRICLNTSETIDVPDGKDIHLGVTVRHAIRLYSCIRDKWLLFCCRSAIDKQRWLQAFAEERKLVAQDKNDGLEFPSAARDLARIAAQRCQKRPPRKPRGGNSMKRAPYMASNLQLNSNSLGRKVGTWFTFGGNKKSRHHQSRDHVS